MSKKVTLTFGTAEGRKASLTMDDPKEGLKGEDVRAAMDTVIAANVFERVAGDSFAAVEEAVVTETTETPLI